MYEILVTCNDFDEFLTCDTADNRVHRAMLDTEEFSKVCVEFFAIVRLDFILSEIHYLLQYLVVLSAIQVRVIFETLILSFLHHFPTKLLLIIDF